MLNHTQFAANSIGPPAVSVAETQEESRLSSMRVNWQLKAILPIGLVLLAGLLLFTLATVSLRNPERHAVLIVAGAGAVAIVRCVHIRTGLFDSTSHGGIAGENGAGE
jgi:hypothetical protein